MKKLSFTFIIIHLYLFFLTFETYAQPKLNPGFDPAEYRQMLEISARQIDTPWTNVAIPFPENCKLEFRSGVMGLDNRWDLWLREDSVGIISIRGTTAKANSWAEDFYAAMVPAKGSLIIDSDFVFIYNLASYPGASVHAGWLTGLAYLSGSVVTKINEYYPKGIKNYIIMGHSQGGAIAYLLTSYLYYLNKERIPEDVNFKTYCSAPPKPGNLNYAYDFDYITRGGFAMRVYNSEDWVPQTPLSVQTLDDFSKVNPYSDREMLMVKMNFIEKLVFDYLTDKLKNKLNSSKDVLNEFFGNMTYKNSVRKYLPGFPEPRYTEDTYYYPCGVPVVLMKQEGYDQFIKTETNIPELFKNHMISPYYFLLNKIYSGK